MPSRFSAAFRRKSATSPDEFQIQPANTEPSFRVLERGQPQSARTFDGGARMARASAHLTHKPTFSDPEVEDNMFAGLNVNRGSGGSNTTKATSTDTSSRHSNASTAPSSADMPNNLSDDAKASKRVPAHEPAPSRQSNKTNSFLDRAGRTFSFGMQKRNQTPTKEDPVPDVPPLPTLQREDEHGRTRAMTASTASTATPPKLEGGSALDLGGDFGSMFTSFDKRASQATLKMDGSANQRQGQPAPLNIDNKRVVDPSPGSWNSAHSDDNLMSSSTLLASDERGPPVPRHQPSFEYRSSTSPTGIVEDEDARLLADSVAATRFLSSPTDKRSPRYRQEEQDFSVLPRHNTIAAEFDNEDNMFAGTAPKFSRPNHYTTVRSASPPRGAGKVMTTAEFERYQKEKNRQHLERQVYGGSAEDDDDDEDEINYDDDEDEEEKAKEQAKRTRNKQAQMQAYRQKNMKTTGGTDLGRVSPLSSGGRPGLPTSLSTPHLGVTKTPSPEPAKQPANEDDDEEVPLAILQAHGFPTKNRAPSRLSVMGSNPNLRSTSQAQLRPVSGGGEPQANKRASTLPAFARGLPQDPFVGANVSRPAVRESLSFGGGSGLQPPQPQQHQPMHPGGLVGVIASEERARAMRRGSPNMEGQKPQGHNFDPISGIPPHMMYGNGQQGMPQQGMPQQPHMSAADQAQLQMSQQMTQFMQMQMQFMQMMAQNGQNPQQMPHGMPEMGQMPQMGQMGQQPYGMPGVSQSSADLSSGHSMYGQQAPQPRRMNASMRTMSMVQPNTSSQYLQLPHIQGPGGYTPSIAPSERSNIGLPGRYRPVSQASGSVSGQQPIHNRSASISGALSLSPNDDAKSRSTIKAVSTVRVGSDDDDEEGWEAMRAKRDQKKSRWRRKKEADF